MADGTVTIKALFDGKDAESGAKRIKSSLEGLKGSAGKVGSVFKSVLGANLIGGAIMGGISALGNGMKSMVGELNSSTKAWKTFEGNMQQINMPTEQIQQVKGELQDFATKTIYSASDMASTYSQLAAVGTKNTTELVKGFGGLAAAAENPQQAMKTLSQQATQMAAKPKVQWQDFKLMLEQTPAGIAAIAKEMGMSTAEMVQAVQDGKIKTEDFFDAIAKVGNNDTFSKMATEFKTVDQAIDGMKESLANKLMPQFEKLNQIGIKAVVGLTDALENIDINGIADKIGSGLSSLWKGFANTGALANLGATFTYISSSIQQLFSKIDGSKLMQGIGSVFGDIANGISQALNIATTSVRSFISSFADTGAFQSFKAAVQDTWNALKTIGSSFGEVLGSSQMQSIIAGIGSALGTLVSWISQVISAISRFISAIPPGILNGITSGILAMVAGFMTAKAGISAVSAALRGLDFIKSLNPFKKFGSDAAEGMAQAATSASRGKSKIAQVFESIGGVIKNAGSAISQAAKGIGTGISTAFKGIGTAINIALQGLRGLNPATLLSFGASVAIAAVGIGAGIGIIVASFALLATQSQGVSQILNAIGSAFGTVVESIGKAAGTIVEAFGTAFATVITAVGEAAPGLAQLSPLVEAVGTALGNAAPFITAFGNAWTSILGTLPAIISAFSGLATALGNAISTVVTAITPIVQIIGNTITAVTQIIANAIVAIAPVIANCIVQVAQVIGQFGPQIAMVLQVIVQAIQATAPVIMTLIQGIVTVVQTLAPVISQVISAIVTVVQTLAPIISQII